MNYPALYDFYFPPLPNVSVRKYTIMPGAASLGYWLRALRPIKFERVR